MTILALVKELSTWVSFDDVIIERATRSNMTTTNNKDLKKLVSDWMNGKYDEDISYLQNEVENLLPKAKKF